MYVVTVNKKIVHTVFEETAERFPGRTAVRQAGRGISYGDLSRASDDIATILKRVGVGRDVIVGVLLESGIEYVAAIIGVMKAGGVFLPLDLSFPEKRLEYMLRKTVPEVIISETAFEAIGRRLAAMGFDHQACPVILIDRDLRATLRGDHGPEEKGDDADPTGGDGVGSLPDPDDSCYIMYTSGSTGVPKAIEGCYKSLSHFVHWEVKEFGFDERVRVTQLPPVTFDASLRDIFVPLITGGTLCIPEKGTRANMKELVAWMEAEGITLIHCVPSLFRLMIREIEESSVPPSEIASPEAGSEKGQVSEGVVTSETPGEDRGSGEILPALRYILMAGEPLYGKDVIRWMDLVGERVTLVNLYGPSETTLVKTFHPIRQRPADPNAMIPAGQPIANTAILITKRNRLCEPGEIGDIFIKTPFRTKGYYRDPELTKLSFVPNPLTGDPADIVYKTGDIGRYLADRGVEFIGRLDTQVKINGIRIELGEIEKTLLGSNFIDQTVVTGHRSSENETTLVCYYTEKRATDAGEISAWLRQALPSYMVPSFYVRLAEFPLNINGKIDRKALPKPEELIYEEIAYEAPADDREEALARIWGEVLHLKKVGVNSPFFQIGGHSLTATRVLSRIYREMGVEVSLRDFFANQTIRRLAALLKEHSGSGFARISPLERQPDYAVSSSQRRLWVLDRMEEGSVAYSLPGLFMVEGDLDIPAFRRAFSVLIARHESLRTTFFETDVGPRQKVIEAADSLEGFAIGEIDLSQAPDAEERALQYARDQATVPFDLFQGPLLRVTVITLPRGRYAIFFNMHHIIGDAWSLDILARDLLGIYRACREGKGNPLSPLRVQYRDYAAWQNARLEADETSKTARYWHEKLSGAGSSPLDLPWDDPRPPLQTYRGETFFFDLDERLTTGLTALARKHDASLFMILLGLVKTLLYRYSGQEDIIVGSPVACRNHPDLEDQIGFYANTLALRDRIDAEETFVSVLEKVKRTVIDAYDHQHYPFDRLVDELGLVRDPGRAPLFDVMLVVQERETPPVQQGPLRITPVEAAWGASRFDLTFEMAPSAAGLRIGINYNTDLFRGATIERMASHVTTLAESILADPSTAIGNLEIIAPAEKRLLTGTFNDTRHPYPADKTIVDLFEAQVAERPDHIAIVLEEREIPYRELGARARGVAGALIETYRVEPQETVGLMVGRGEWSVIGLMGILMAGGVYLPVDPALPLERIRYLLEDSGCRVLLVQGNPDETNGSLPGAVTAVDIGSMAPPDDPLRKTDPLPRRSSPDSPAYIIYTSGSTGLPKGVLIGQSGFVNMALDQIRVFGVTDTDRVLQFASPSFDASLSEVFMALLAGAAVVVVSKETIDDPLAFVRYLAEKRVSNVTLPPVYLNALDKEGLTTVTTIITAGEAPNAQDARYLSRRKRYFNAYGPTEISVCATIERVSPDGDYPRGIPIGRPIANTSILILDESLRLVPIGVPGEICVSGPGLAKGYINRPELTAERFVAHPFAAKKGQLYRTGDIGRWRPDGTIEWLGRNDDQVKIGGHRIELGEVKNALLRHPAVKEAAILPGDRDSGELVAYFTATRVLEPADLTSHLGGFLPKYMLPRHLIQLDALPLTAHGKVDRKALPDPRAAGVRPDDGQAQPRTDLEKRLLALWREVLGRPDIGMRDNFFDSGGNSLRSLQLISRLSTGLNLKVPVKLLFVNPTVAELSAAIAGQKPAAAAPVRPQGDSSPFSSAMSISREPLLSLFDAGGIGPVDAAAIICLPDGLMDQPSLGKDEIIKRLCKDHPVISSIIHTSLGRIASIVLPRFASEVFSDQAALQGHVAEALELAGHIGADTVSLTGHLPLATDFGLDVGAFFPATNHGPAVTTGQATVTAAMVMTIEKIMRLSGRRVDRETVGLIGLNTIGAATLFLMLACMPYPKRIILADAYNNLLFASVLRQELSDCGFGGPIEILRASEELPPAFYDASLIIGATNIPEIIEIGRVKPGTIIAEESGQHCFSRVDAVRRLETDGDTLFADGDLLRLPAPATCLMYLPEEAERSLRRANAISLLAFDPEAITGCVLSGLLSHRYTDLTPTIGEVDGETCLRHYDFLHRLGFGVTDLHCDGYTIREDSLRRFRERFGTGDASTRESERDGMREST